MSSLKELCGNPVKQYLFKNRSVYFGNKTWSRGVTTTIKKIFSPTYSFSKLKRTSKYTRGLTKQKAIRRGHAIDHTLQRWVEGYYTKRFKLIEPKAIIKEFEKRCWSPLASQLVVAWPVGRIATKLDLVLHDTKQNHILVVEIKSGCGYRYLYNGNMLHITPTIDNCALHQHQLQTLIGTQLFKKTYPKCTLPIRSVLVYVSLQGTVDIIEESVFNTTYSKAIERALLRTV
jgi:hypothetical protein